MSTVPASSGRPLRKDAERNRQRILVAAGELFAEKGLDVTLDAVAERAGVGVATVYRRFADKEQLIDGLFEERLDELGGLAEAALEIEDPWKGFVWFFEEMVALHAADRGLQQILLSGSHGLGRCEAARSRLKPPVERLIGRAQAAGALRADLAGTDFPLIQRMLAAVSEYTRDVEPSLYRRYTAIVLDGLRAQSRAASPLPVPALGDEALQRAMMSGRISRP
jgi:AcrR family transcriptional regulator